MESEIIHTSASRLSSYKQCPRKYYYRYIKKLPALDHWPHLIKGNFAHAVLECWVSRLMDKEEPRAAMIAAYEDTKVSIEFKGKVEKFLEEIKPWLKQALLAYETKHFNPALIEEKVAFKYRKIEVTGRIDRIDNIDSRKIKIIDYKTSKSSNYLTPLQLGIYNIGVKYGSLKELYGQKDVETAYVLLRHEMKEVPYSFSEEQLEEILGQIEETIDTIGADKTWEPCTSNLCQFCDYFIICTQETKGSFDLSDDSFDF